jgi:hypothetical protein
VSALRAVVNSLGDAPAVEPPAEVWHSLRHRLERGKVVGMPGSASGAGFWAVVPRRARWLLAAAAVALVTVSSAVTSLVVRRSAPPITPTMAAAPGTTAALAMEVARVERGYLDSVVELTQALAAARPRLEPGPIAIVERNLAVIDAAIAESRAALLRDPGNRALLEVLSGTYRQKLDLLRRAAQLATS